MNLIDKELTQCLTFFSVREGSRNFFSNLTGYFCVTISLLKDIEEDLKISYFHWAEERWFMKNKFLSRIFELDFTVSEVGIQLADCLASLIRYYHDNPDKKDAKKWFNKLKREKKLSFELLINS